MFGGLHSLRGLTSPTSLIELAREFTPRVEIVDPTRVLLDLHGFSRTWPTPEALGRALIDAGRARSLEARVALAWTRSAALIAARARDGLTVIPAGGEAAFLAPLPVALLDMDPEHLELLSRWGVRTLGELTALPQLGLAERLGSAGPRLVRLARGEDDTPLVPAPEPALFEVALELDWPVDGLEPLAFLLARILESLCAMLKRRGRAAVALELTLGLVDTSRHQRYVRPAVPTLDARTWRTLLVLDLEAHPPRDAIEKIRIRAEPTRARIEQLSLLDASQPSPERLAETLARLGEWVSGGRAGSAALLDTHRPGAFAMGSFAPGRVRVKSGRLGARLALRAFRPPRPAHVEVRAGAPAFVAASGVRGAVIESAGPWHASGDWWDGGWSREEWEVALREGGLFRIFQDRMRGVWYVEGELD